MMECYLPPLHYWISYAITLLTGDPVMMGHWVHLIQAVVSITFIFLAVRYVASTPAGFFAAMWLVHTRHIMQRMTGGVPRGWAAVVFTAFLYFLLSGNHLAVLVTIAIGCILHPPSTLIIALTYGLYLTWRVFIPRTRREYKPHFIRYLLLSPVFVIATYSVVSMPEEIGTMASYSEAASMPEFQKPDGRFPFVPLNPAWSEIRSFGFQAFIGRFFNPGRFWKAAMPFAAISVLLLLMLGQMKYRKRIFSAELFWFLIATLSVYFASRLLAFKLYVPDRHLQFPMAIFFIVAFTIGAWRLGYKFPRGEGEDLKWRYPTTLSKSWRSVLALFFVGVLIFQGSGMNLRGAANFNTSLYKRGEIWVWFRENTPQKSLVAGYPTWVDPVMLFGIRRAFVTTETAHPFYDVYNAEMKRRLDISLRAHYAKSEKEFLDILEPAGVDYFVFQRALFTDEALRDSKYFPPFNEMIKLVTSAPQSAFLFSKLLTIAKTNKLVVPYVDKYSLVVDVRALASSTKR